jgi:hypothetical protein
LGDEGGEAVRILGTQFRESIIAALCEFESRIRIVPRNDLQRRSRQ